jgi:molecular chaperone GrpE
MLPRASRSLVAALARRLPAASSEPIVAAAAAAPGAPSLPSPPRALPWLQARALSSSSTSRPVTTTTTTTTPAAATSSSTAAAAAAAAAWRRRGSSLPRRSFASAAAAADGKDDKEQPPADGSAANASSSDSDNGGHGATPEQAEDQQDGDATTNPLAKELDEAKKKAALLTERLQYALAEAENVRQRAQREIQSKSQYAVADLAKQLLDVADNMWRAEEAVPKPVRDALFGEGEGAADNAAAQLDAPKATALLKALLVGLRATDRGLHEVLKKQGIERYDPTGDAFDPNLHAAMFQVPDGKLEPGTVAAVHRRGYTIKGRVLRAAEVGVAKEP